MHHRGVFGVPLAIRHLRRREVVSPVLPSRDNPTMTVITHLASMTGVPSSVAIPDVGGFGAE